MRSYPRDSPQAAARIVALALIADGHLSREEVAALESILDEIRDPLLRLRVLQLCLAAISADGHVAPGESAIVRAALLRWNLDEWPRGDRKAA